jgi:hypothetical protein
MKTKTRQRAGQHGFALIALFALMIPMLIIVGAFSSTMTGRTNELRVELDEELALLACESGVDDAIYQGRIGNLTSGGNYNRSLGNGQSFVVEPTYLGDDSQDNDGDSKVDEKDEDVFQIIVTGRYRQTQRRIAAYLGPIPLLPAIEAAVVTHDPNVAVQLQGTPLITGNDTNINGGAGPGPNVPGIAIAPPGTVSHLDSELTGSERTKVQGIGPSPSLGVATAIDIPTLVAQIQNVANLVLTSDQYSSFTFGDASADTTKIAYRNGNVKFAGNTRGAGILVVTGNLTVVGNFRYDGVIIVLGEIDNSAGTAQIYGSILQGPAGGAITFKGTADVRYSSEAVALANSASGAYVSFIGWQELAR